MIDFSRYEIDPKKQIALYEGMLYPRMIEEKMLLLLRQGKISKWFSGIGQEAISIGVSSVLLPEEYVFPMHRNLGVFTARGIPLHRLFAQWQGLASGFTKGRDRSFHFGSKEHKVVGMISHLGPQLSLAAGTAMAHKLKKEEALSIAFTGEGGTSEGEFHEALNVAAVWKLPVIFVIENNGYGLSTPVREQYACEKLSDKAKGYGMNGVTIDGNNILEVYATLQRIADEIRQDPKPYLVECETFRMRGHEEASGTKYVPKELMDEWARKDPIENFEAHLVNRNILSINEINSIKSDYKNHIQVQLNMVDSESSEISDTKSELRDVYRPLDQGIKLPGDDITEMRFIDAISDSLENAMAHHDDLVIMGQDIAEYGGVFKITDGFIQKFGKDRVRNTPLCESAIIGAGIGLSIKGFRSVIEMQFADFVTCGFNQIVNNAAKLHYRWDQSVGIVIRMPCGGSVGAGPFHSQTNEAWFTHVPGLKIVYPSSPQDAKGLLLSAIDDPNPVLYFEHKALYRSITDKVSNGYYHVPIGKANLVREGSQASIITYGLGVHWAIQFVEENNLDVDILDLRSLVPIDYEAVDISIKKTNRVLILHEDTLFGGLGGEISAYISEHLFEYLDAPVIRAGSLDTPIPFSKDLERQFLATAMLQDKMNTLLSY